MTQIPEPTRYERAQDNLDALNAGWAESHSAPSELFQRLRFQLLDELQVAETEVSHLKAARDSAEELVENIKTGTIFEVEGRNEAERKANQNKLLEGHGRYQEARATLAGIAGECVDAEARLHRLQREWTALSLQIQLRISVLNFLASEQ